MKLTPGGLCLYFLAKNEIVKKANRKMLVKLTTTAQRNLTPFHQLIFQKRREHISQDISTIDRAISYCDQH
jgi:hypothetical protein